MLWQRADSVIDGVAHVDAVASFELAIKQQQPALKLHKLLRAYLRCVCS